MYCVSSGLFGDPSRVLQSYSRSSFHWCCRDSTTATRPLRSTWSRVEQTPVSPECCCMTYLRGEQVRSCNTASTRSTVVARARAYRIDFKIAVLIYRCLHGLAPAYLSTELQSVKGMPSRQRLRMNGLRTLSRHDVAAVYCRRPRLSSHCGTSLERSDYGRYLVDYSASFQATAQD